MQFLFSVIAIVGFLLPAKSFAFPVTRDGLRVLPPQFFQGPEQFFEEINYAYIPHGIMETANSILSQAGLNSIPKGQESRILDIMKERKNVDLLPAQRDLLNSILAAGAGVILPSEIEAAVPNSVNFGLGKRGLESPSSDSVQPRSVLDPMVTLAATLPEEDAHQFRPNLQPTSLAMASSPMPKMPPPTAAPSISGRTPPPPPSAEELSSLRAGLHPVPPEPLHFCTRTAPEVHNLCVCDGLFEIPIVSVGWLLENEREMFWTTKARPTWMNVAWIYCPMYFGNPSPSLPQSQRLVAKVTAASRDYGYVEPDPGNNRWLEEQWGSSLSYGTFLIFMTVLGMI